MPRKNKGPHLSWREERQLWEIRWFEHGRKFSQSTRTQDRKEAERILAEFILGAEPVGTCDTSQRIIADVLSRYAEERGPHVADPERIAYTIEALIPFWGRRKVADVREGTCRAYGEHRQVSDGTLRRELTTLRAAINHDYKQGRLTATVPIWLPPKPDGKDRWLTRSEAARLLWAARKMEKARNYLPLFIILGLYTGARKETILSLRWPQIDFKRGLIDLNPRDRQRTVKGRPIIPIPRRLMIFLRLARKYGTDLGPVVSIPRVITNEHGRKQTVRLPIKDVKKSFHEAACRAGLVTHWAKSKKKASKDKNVSWIYPVTDVTPHILRHTAASWMVQRGVSFAKVARYLGHSDSRTTEQVYAHHAPDYLEEARAAFD